MWLFDVYQKYIMMTYIIAYVIADLLGVEDHIKMYIHARREVAFRGANTKVWTKLLHIPLESKKLLIMRL